MTVKWPRVNGKQYIETYLNNIPFRSEIVFTKPDLNDGDWYGKDVLYVIYDGDDYVNGSCLKVF